MRQLVTAGREGQPSPGCPAQCRPADLERTRSDDRHGNCQRPDACATGRSRTTSSPARRTGTRRAADHQSDCPLRDERLRRHLGNPGPGETVEPYVPALGDDACRGGEERFSLASCSSSVVPGPAHGRGAPRRRHLTRMHRLIQGACGVGWCCSVSSSPEQLSSCAGSTWGWVWPPLVPASLGMIVNLLIVPSTRSIFGDHRVGHDADLGTGDPGDTRHDHATRSGAEGVDTTTMKRRRCPGSACPGG